MGKVRSYVLYVTSHWIELCYNMLWRSMGRDWDLTGGNTNKEGELAGSGAAERGRISPLFPPESSGSGEEVIRRLEELELNFV